MMKDSLNKKTYIGDIEPNPKEFGIWVKQDGTAKVYDYINNEWKGGSGNGEASTVEYLQIPENFDRMLNTPFIMSAQYVRCYYDFGPCIETPGITSANYNYPIIEAVAINLNQTIYKSDSKHNIVATSLKEYLIRHSLISEELLNSLPRITKEEFYSLT